MLRIEKYQDEIKNLLDKNYNLFSALWKIVEEHGESKTYRDKDILEWLLTDEKELPQEFEISSLEYHQLHVLKEYGFNYIARDNDNSLYSYEKRPVYSDLRSSFMSINNECRGVDDDLYEFITFESGPVNIHYILTNCKLK